MIRMIPTLTGFTALLLCLFVAAPGAALELIGTDGHDKLVGTNKRDRLSGKDGDDWLYGKRGNDELFGDDGFDWLFGGRGRDKLYGGSGEDWLEGGRGDDVLDGGDDFNVLLGGPGNDRLYAGQWGRVYGGPGNDELYGGEFVAIRTADELWGGEGNDLIKGYGGADELWGGPGKDELYGGDGNDDLHGDAERVNGSLTISAAGDDDILYGGEGHDNMNGHGGNDELYGGEGNDHMAGGAGDDWLEGGPGNDYLLGDSFYPGTGSDTLVFAPGHGNDRIPYFDLGLDTIDLSAFAGITSFDDLTLSEWECGFVINLTQYGGGTIQIGPGKPCGHLHIPKIEDMDASDFVLN